MQSFPDIFTFHLSIEEEGQSKGMLGQSTQTPAINLLTLFYSYSDLHKIVELAVVPSDRRAVKGESGAIGVAEEAIAAVGSNVDNCSR